MCAAVWLQAHKPFSCKHLSVLGKLNNLEQLAIQIPGHTALLDVPGNAPQLCSWLASLSSLTHLVLSIPTVSGVCSISGCTSLCDLSLQGAAVKGAELQLGDTEWDALGHLTRLTALDVYEGFQAVTVSDACTAALSRLGGLVALWGPLWTEDSLQVLSQLPHLSQIRGCWGAGQRENAAPTRASDLVCSQVTLLEVMGGDVPFQAFPNLLKLSLRSNTTMLTLQALAGLAQCCPKLQEVWVPVGQGPTHQNYILDDTTPLAQRVASIKSLSRLEHLSVLGWKPSVDAEMAAVVAAAESLAKLKHVAVVRESGSRVSCVGLLHLARLVQVEKLEILWNDETVLPDVAGATGLLSVLCRVPRLEVLAAGPRSEGRMQEARRSCEQQGLPLSQGLVIKRV